MYLVPMDWVRHASIRIGSQSAIVTAALRAAGLSTRLSAYVPRTSAQSGTGEAMVRATAFVTFLEEAARQAGDDLLGFGLGFEYDLRQEGLVGYAAISAPTLRAALASAARYAGLRDTAADVRLAETAGAPALRVETRCAQMRASRQASEFRLALILAAGRRWFGPGFRPTEMRLAYPRGAGLRALERRADCPVVAGAETTEIALTPEQLDLPSRAADPFLLALVTRHAEAALAGGRGSREGDLREQVEQEIAARLAGGAPLLGEIADALGLGERTLARRLAEAGTPYRTIIDELRAGLARTYLADQGIALAQVAGLLGYSEQSAFTNAFRRWAGQSPRRFRAGLPA